MNVVPFWTASVAGTDKFVRTWRDDPKRAALITALMVSATAAYTVSRWDDDEYEEEPSWLKYGFFNCKCCGLSLAGSTGAVHAFDSKADGLGSCRSGRPAAVWSLVKAAM